MRTTTRITCPLSSRPSGPAAHRLTRRQALLTMGQATLAGAVALPAHAAIAVAGRAATPASAPLQTPRGASAAPVTTTTAASAPLSHYPFGPVLPARPLPAWRLTTHQGRATDLAQLLQGHTTALQLMFTGCSATCPIQGALFAQAQQQLGGNPADTQFLSISIDPLSDTPAALATWLRNLSAQPGWLAAAPRIEDVTRLVTLLGEGGEPKPRGRDPHTGQVYIVNRRGELVFRTASLPAADQIVAALRRVSQRKGN